MDDVLAFHLITKIITNGQYILLLATCRRRGSVDLQGSHWFSESEEETGSFGIADGVPGIGLGSNRM